MILQNQVKTIIELNQDKNPLLVRNLIKEELQNYILHFIFTKNKYVNLIFTGGTCLRKLYGLNRLSEDLDFDYNQQFNIEDFAKDVVNYFRQTVQYNSIRISIANNGKTVYFKFPLLKELKVYEQNLSTSHITKWTNTPPDLFVRCDFVKNKFEGAKVEQRLIIVSNFQFFVNAYDLPTLFSNKVVAFLQRMFFKDKRQKYPFKGRDVYDLYWLTSLMINQFGSLKINKKRLLALLPQYSLDEIEKLVKERLDKIDERFLEKDLRPMFEDKVMLKNFLDNYKVYLQNYFKI